MPHRTTLPLSHSLSLWMTFFGTRGKFPHARYHCGATVRLSQTRKIRLSRSLSRDEDQTPTSVRKISSGASDRRVGIRSKLPWLTLGNGLRSTASVATAIDLANTAVVHVCSGPSKTDGSSAAAFPTSAESADRLQLTFVANHPLVVASPHQ